MGRHRLRRSLRFVAAVAGVAVLSFVAVLAVAFMVDTGGDPRSLRGVAIDGVPAGYMSLPELEAVTAALAAEAATRPVLVDLPDRTESIPAGDLGISLDADPAVASALDSGRGGPLWRRIWSWIGSFTGHHQLTTTDSYDPDQAYRRLEELPGLVVESPVEPILVMSSEGDLVVREGTAGVQVDVPGTVDRLGAQVGQLTGTFQVDAPRRPLAPSPAADLVPEAERLNDLTAGGVTLRLAGEERELTAQAIRSRLVMDEDRRPRFDHNSLTLLVETTFDGVVLGGDDPRFDMTDEGPELVEPGSPPEVCCAPDSAELVAETVLEGLGGVVDLEPRADSDPRQVAWARGEGVVDEVSSFTTEYQCCQARVDNIHRFADLVRGVYLNPGESLSLNEHVGERTPEKGFVPAGSIEFGHLVSDVGGGVSQFATTMFNAAFFAGFDFEAYQSHSLYFTRYPYGREATISHPLPDLEVTNTTDHPALIWTSHTPTSVTVSIYSTPHIEVTETGQEVTPIRQCTRVDTFRERTYPDGRVVEDSVFATYRPGEGLDCDGDAIPVPES